MSSPTSPGSPRAKHACAAGVVRSGTTRNPPGSILNSCTTNVVSHRRVRKKENRVFLSSSARARLHTAVTVPQIQHSYSLARGHPYRYQRHYLKIIKGAYRSSLCTSCRDLDKYSIQAVQTFPSAAGILFRSGGDITYRQIR